MGKLYLLPKRQRVEGQEIYKGSVFDELCLWVTSILSLIGFIPIMHSGWSLANVVFAGFLFIFFNGICLFEARKLFRYTWSEAFATLRIGLGLGAACSLYAFIWITITGTKG